MEQAVLYALDNGFLESAVFLSEQLHHADSTNDNTRFLHGLCLLRAGELNKAHLLTQAVKHLGCAFVFARTCLALKTYKAGVLALLAVTSSWSSTSHFYNHTESTRRLLPDRAAVSCLLGHLYRQDHEIKRAIECYVHAVKANPFLWEAFEGLMSMGAEMQVKNVFKQSDVLTSARSMLEDSGSSVMSLREKGHNPLATPDVFGQTSRPGVAKNYTFRPTLPLSRLDELETPNGPMTPTMAPDGQSFSLETMNNTTIQAPVRTKTKTRLPDLSAPKFGLSRALSEPNNGGSRAAVTKDESASSSGQRRSTRLNLSSIRTASKGGLKKSSRTTQAGAPIFPSQIESDPTPMATGRQRVSSGKISRAAVTLPSLDAENALLTLLRQIGEGYYALSRYQCLKSIETLKSLEPNVKASPSLLAKLGRAYYENGNYEDAIVCYRDLRRIAPARLQDMEIYSTCLWHLHKEVELSYLAHEMMDLDRLSPQAWCILANCLSLHREHDQALRCVGRAIQLDGDFAYAHTLEGHEYAANEEFEKARTSFRNAIRADKRHYNAWYGLGMADMKTGNNDQAEAHFVKASQINPTNAVLVCCIGIVMERSKRWADALRQYEKACQLAPTNALARFKKAKALIMARDYKSAMNDLHILKELAPDEANVHYLLGKMYRQFGDKSSAMKHLTIAMNLDNKASHLVKEAIENMDELDNSMAQ